MGRDGSVGMVAFYELGGQEIESRGGRNFPNPSTPAHSTSNTRYIRGAKRRGVALTTQQQTEDEEQLLASVSGNFKKNH